LSWEKSDQPRPGCLDPIGKGIADNTADCA
jgi:hypothetical protein